MQQAQADLIKIEPIAPILLLTILVQNRIISNYIFNSDEDIGPYQFSIFQFSFIWN